MIGYIYAICYNGEICYTGRTINMRERWNAYRYQHKKTEDPDIYNMKIHAFMREKGFDNFEMMLLESFEVEKDSDLNYYEGIWQTTFEDLGFDLLNTQKAGNGDTHDLGSIAYQNNRARSKEKIPCELCGKLIGRCHIRRHQQSSNCLPENSSRVVVA